MNANGNASLVAFGIPFLASLDLVQRFREDLPLNEVDSTSFYDGNEVGYTDYAFYHYE